MTKISAQERKKNAELLRTFLRDMRQGKIDAKIRKNITNKKKKKTRRRKTKRRRKSRKKKRKITRKGGTKKRRRRRNKQRGGTDLKFTLPEVQYQDATAAMGGAIYKQKTNNLQISQLKNTQNGGRKEVVPQLQSAGAEGNKNIKGMIGALLNARIDGQGDSKATLLGGGKRKTRRKR